MPDWSYRTVLRPLLYRLPAETARDFSLEAMGTLARLPGGRTVIDLMGHMRPDPALRRVVGGIEFATTVGLGPALDVHVRALPALERFGFGFVEVGPVSASSPPAEVANAVVVRDDGRGAFRFQDLPRMSSAVLARQLQADGPPRVPLIVRLGEAATVEPHELVELHRMAIAQLSKFTRLFSTAALRTHSPMQWPHGAWDAYARELVGLARAAIPDGAMFLCVPTERPPEVVDPLIDTALAAGLSGLIVDGAVEMPGGEIEFGGPAREPAVQVVRRLRTRLGPDVPLIAAGGVHQPRQALDLLDAGADLVEIDSGLVFGGPGLPKRVNESVRSIEAARKPAAGGIATAEPIRAVDSCWLWALLLGVGLFIGGTIAVAIASTRIVLPYDEMLTGLNRDQLHAINDNLLAFMAHDRVSVAGTMFAVGVFYCGLAWFGIRHGAHWAFVAVMASSVLGFCTFFSFLGFGYFDPFHAFVSTIMFQLQLMAIRGRMSAAEPARVPDLDDDRAWRLAQWGQLGWIIHGCGLLGAGAVILSIACTFVFVETDLDFLCTTAEALRSSHPRVVGLVAHDRAAFGGMLMAAGVTILLSSMWGFVRGRRWLWWTLVGGSLPGYAAALVVHLAVGYDDWFHMLPVSIGLTGTLVAAAFSHRYLCRSD